MYLCFSFLSGVVDFLKCFILGRVLSMHLVFIFIVLFKGECRGKVLPAHPVK